MSPKTRFSVYSSVCVPTLLYGYELWAVAERKKLWIQVTEISFPWWLHMLSGWLALLLLNIERSQFRWFGHLVRMLPGHLPGEVFQTCSTGRRPLWRHIGVGWENLGIPLEELEEVDRESSCPRNQNMDKWKWMDGWMMWNLSLRTSGLLVLQTFVTFSHLKSSNKFFSSYHRSFVYAMI